MGYTTDFVGHFNITPTLTPEHREYLAKFNETRRMKRDGIKAMQLPDPIRDAAILPIGEEGDYFVGANGSFGQDRDDSILEYNYPPTGQPGLRCQWTPSEDGTRLEWDGGEKFYSYVEWLEYIIEHFLNRWGYSLEGDVEWLGEDREDHGMIHVENNKVTTKIARTIWE